MKKLEEIEDYFDYRLEKRMIFIIFNKNAEYKQSNIGLVTFDEDSYNTGGFSRIIKNKVMLYYEGDHVAFQKQISASITEVIKIGVLPKISPSITRLTNLFPEGSPVYENFTVGSASSFSKNFFRAVLFDFSLALMIGVLIGTYSSIFVASPLIFLWRRQLR
jgi:hypothetical protein